MPLLSRSPRPPGPFRRGRAALGVLLATALTTGLGGCAVGPVDSGAAVVGYPSRGLSILAPGSVGGGFDSRARGIGGALTGCGVTDEDVTVSNAPGAAGTIGLARLAGRADDPYQLMTMDTVTLLGGEIQNHSPVSLTRLTPIAGLTVSTTAIVVPAKSPYRDLPSLIRATAKKPRAIKWVGGSLGGPDHITVASLAQRVHLAPDRLTYVPTGGGGEVLNMLLSGVATAGLSTLSEIRPQVEAGKLRTLAVSGGSSPKDLGSPPTLDRLGYGDDAVDAIGGVMAPPGLNASEQRAVVRLVDKMRHTSCWKKTLRENDWDEVWLPGRKFGDLISRQQKQVGAVLKEVGLG
ncbi:MULTISPECIES: Bug family tripartite tricarboxylate transporter substrate binding protein [unclassified Streptomyces]|uniref:Bug family tripartite tricarboxylate transporter substrate binding protein n=1 Tax=unclassified Streptomyces TaxID=2593676 RepID=UPI002E192C91